MSLALLRVGLNLICIERGPHFYFLIFALHTWTVIPLWTRDQREECLFL